MKIAVFSDTHKRISGVLRVIEGEQPDLIIHLGDHIKDAYAIAETVPGIPMECVPGNCDYAPTEPEMKLITLMGVKFMLTHGHNYRVKYETTSLLNAAYFQGADIVLFGHTHRPVNDAFKGLRIVNPGSAGQGSPATWARIELERGIIRDISILKI